MTKLATPEKLPPVSPPPNPPAAHHGGGLFFRTLVKASGITRKELQYDLRWSKTYVDMILSGEKNDPLEQARKFCALLLQRSRMDLVAATLVHIAGGDSFDGRVLTPEQVDALKELAKVVA